MREILFRGKPKGKNEWITGNLLFYPDVNRAYMSQGVFKGGTFLEVLKDTVGQYTGLTDKNGKKIFEGDIVVCRIVGIRETVEHKGVVVYSEDSFAVDIKGIVPDQKCLVFSKKNGDVEVIGNIYDNSELLREGAE